jgi:hypothetical protein
LQFLASVGGLIGLIATVIYTARAADGAKRAAEAADRAVEVQIRIEQPMLAVRTMSMGLSPDSPLEFTAQNVGKTAAILLGWSANVSEIDPPVGAPVYRSEVSLRGTVMQPDDPAQQLLTYAEDIVPPDATIYFWGYLRYEDVFGTVRRTGFGYCGRTSPLAQLYDTTRRVFGWERYGGDAYNYDRQEPSKS